jgi:hypothetical protein
VRSAFRRSPFAVCRSQFAVRPKTASGFWLKTEESPFAVSRSQFAVRRSLKIAVCLSPFAVRPKTASGCWLLAGN